MNIVSIDSDIVGEILRDIEKELDLEFVHTRAISKPNVRRSRLFLILGSSNDQRYCLKLYAARPDKAFSESFERYATIYRTVPDKLKSNLAEPFLNGEHRGIYFSLEGYLDGKPMKPFLERRLVSFKRKQNLITQSLDWLVEYKKAFDPLDCHKTDLLANLNQYNELFRCSRKEKSLLELLEQRVGSGNFDDKYFVQHGDLSIENVLINKETVGIFDWELTGSETIPHHDLFVFLTTSIYCIENCFDKNRENGFRSIFSKSRNRDLFVESLRSYATGLDIRSDFAHLFFPYYLVTLPVILKKRRSSPMTVASARKNAEVYAAGYDDIDDLLTL